MTVLTTGLQPDDNPLTTIRSVKRTATAAHVD